MNEWGGSMMKKQLKKLLAGGMAVVMAWSSLPVHALPAYAEEAKASDAVYSEDFTYPDEVGNTSFLPDGWSVQGEMPTIAAIRSDGENYYYEIERMTDSIVEKTNIATSSNSDNPERATSSNPKKRTTATYSNSQKSSYIGTVFKDDLTEAHILSYDLCYTNSGNVDLFMYESRLNAGNLAVRVGIKNGDLYAFDGSTQKTLVKNVEALGWVNLSYAFDNSSKEYEVILADMAGVEQYRSGKLAYNNQNSKAGAFSIKSEIGTSISIDNLELKKQEPEPEPEHPVVDFYNEDFTYPEELENEAFMPDDWTTAGTVPSLMAVREDGDNFYYEIDRTGDSGSSYIGKRFTMTLPDQYVVSLDMNYTNAANINLFMYDNGLNSGNLAVRSGITKSNEGGNLYVFDGGTNKVLVKNIEGYGWINLSYILDNAAQTFEIVLADLEGNELYHSEKLSFHKSAAGKAGAFALNCSPDAKIQIDNVRIYGEDKPYRPSPVEPLPEKTGKVKVVDHGTEFVLSNDYTKMEIKKYDATVTSMIRYISGHSELEDGGYEVLGGGTGYYLLNYVLNGNRLQCAVKNAVGEIVKQADDYCEVVITLDDVSHTPVALELHFILEADTEGVYMYARSRRATGAVGEVEIEQSRYSFRMDSRLYGYSAVADRDLTAFPEFEDYRDRVFDATYIMDDGSIYTKYNNNSYQYNSFVCGAYGEEFGFSLITPSREWAGGGYAKQDIDVHDSGSNTTRLVNWHFATSHYGTGWAKVSEDWEKLYGPVLWYANYGNSKEEIRQAAVEKTEEELQNWPYNWVDDEEYAAEVRSNVTGTFSVANGEIVESNNDISPEGTCGWAVLSDSRSESWQKDNTYYEYYAPIQDDGSFTITGIRPGNYRLNINVNGVIGEYEQNNIVIGKNITVDLGDIVWENPVYGETLWTIGIPDRTSEEYAGGKPYRLWGSHLMFDQLFPEGITYKVGESDYTKDWYYVHMASQTSGMLAHNDGSFYFDEDEKVVKYDASLGTPITVDDERWKGDQATKWDIVFENDKKYESGTATLMVAIAGGRGATLVVRVNGVQVTDVINITESGGGFPRSAALDQYITIPVRFDASLLKEGENTITLSHERPSYTEGQTEIAEMTAYKSIMYDAIRLDVDGKAAETQITGIMVKPPMKLNYEIGEVFNPTGMTVTVHYNDGNTVEMPYTSCVISGFDSNSPGEKTVTVSYNGFEDHFNITVNSETAEKRLTHIKISELPVKLNYYVGEKFDPSGIKLEKVYDDGTVEALDVERCSIAGFDSTRPGSCQITIRYKEYSAGFEVTVNKKEDSDGSTDTSTVVSTENSSETTKSWEQDSRGWKYLDNTGLYAANEWKNIDGRWYYFGEDSYMDTGWIFLNGVWYWLDPGTGAMVENDWVYYKDNWYYLNTGGVMATGWKEYKGEWYYLMADGGKSHGRMLTNSITPDGYYVGSDGKWVKDRG